MKFDSTEIIGERVKLVPMHVNHIEGLFEAGSDARIWTYMPELMKTIDDTKRIVTDALTSQELGLEFPFTIIDQNTNKIIGSSRFLNISPKNRRLEIGWTWYNPSVWRTGVNTECKYLLLSHCFEKLSAIRVEFKTAGQNIRSQKAVERLGAVKEGILREHRISPIGEIDDSVCYSITSKEWPDVKLGLQNFLTS